MTVQKKRGPIQAGDYGKDASPMSPRQTEAQPQQPADRPQTDGRKTLALWSS